MTSIFSFFYFNYIRKLAFLLLTCMLILPLRVSLSYFLSLHSIFVLYLSYLHIIHTYPIHSALLFLPSQDRNIMSEYYYCYYSFISFFILFYIYHLCYKYLLILIKINTICYLFIKIISIIVFLILLLCNTKPTINFYSCSPIKEKHWIPKIDFYYSKTTYIFLQEG